jgi:hypothetical protein
MFLFWKALGQMAPLLSDDRMFKETTQVKKSIKIFFIKQPNNKVQTDIKC